MFSIYDGRDTFYQWDLDRKVIVNDESISQVHFCNRTDNCSLVVETYKEDGLTLANVPNILLQNNWQINVYAYDGKATKHSAVFKVIGRTKPADYIYTETEILDYKHIEDDLKQLQEEVEAIKETGTGSYDADIEALKAEDKEIKKTLNLCGDSIRGLVDTYGGGLLEDISRVPQTLYIDAPDGLYVSTGLRNLFPQPYYRESHDNNKGGIHFEVNDNYTLTVSSITGNPVKVVSTFPYAGTSSNKFEAKIPYWILPNTTYTFFFQWGYEVPDDFRFRMITYDIDGSKLDDISYYPGTYPGASNGFTFTIDERAEYWYVYLTVPEGFDFNGQEYTVRMALYAGDVRKEYPFYMLFEEPKRIGVDYVPYELKGSEDRVLVLTPNNWAYFNYNKSTEKIIQKLTDAIISLGGNV